jgi:hypothetical protein
MPTCLREYVYEGGFGDCGASQVRVTSETVENTHRVNELVDLARIVTPPRDGRGTAASAPGFSFC